MSDTVLSPIILPRTYATTGGQKIAYYHDGTGAAVVLLHGVGLRLESWFWQIQMLRQHYSVFAVDMPGHGHSDLHSCRHPALKQYVCVLADFIRHVVAAPVFLVGHSMGALVALSVAAQHPTNCRGVAAFNTVYRRSALATKAVQMRADELQQIAAATAPDDSQRNIAAAPVARWFALDKQNKQKYDDEENGVLSPTTAATHCRRWLLQSSLAGYAAAYAVFANDDGLTDDKLKALSMPALFISGDLDKNSTPSMAAQMARITPHGQTKIIDGGGHVAQLTHFGEVNKTLSAFLRAAKKS